MQCNVREIGNVLGLRAEPCLCAPYPPAGYAVRVRVGIGARFPDTAQNVRPWYSTEATRALSPVRKRRGMSGLGLG